MLRNDYNLLTIDLSMFGEGGGEGAAPAGEGSAPAAAAAPAPAEVRYGKQPEQTAAPQQETQTPTPDKGKMFSDLIKGEYKDQYTEATQKLINRRFRDTDAKINAQQPIMDLLASRYGIEDGDAAKILSAVQADTAFWQDAADAAGMTVEQYQTMQRLKAQNKQLTDARNAQQQQYLAQMQYRKWQAEAEALKQSVPDFDLDAAMENDMFRFLLSKGNYPMETAYNASFAEQIAAKAAAAAQKATTDNIKARGNRPAEAGAKASPAFTVKDDVSKLSSKEVLDSFNRILGGERISFSR